MIDTVDQKIGVYSVIERFLKKGYALMAQANKSGNIVLSFRQKNGDEVTLIVAYTEDKSQNSKIFGRCLHWKLYAKDELRHGKNIYYVFIHFDKQLIKHSFYIIPNDEVVKYIKYEHQFWLKSNSSHKDCAFRELRLGLFYEKYNHKVFMAYDYEDKWDLIKA